MAILRDECVLITGAYGFLGRHVARVFSNQGYRVSALGHGDWTQNEWKNWGLSEWHTGDITSESLLKYSHNPIIIVHCAGSGSVGYSFENPLGDFKKTVNTTAEVLDFIRMHNPECKLIYPSSAAVYGNSSSLPLTETMPLRPVSPYGMHKRLVEQLCQSYGEYFHVNSTVIRFFSIYGPGLKKQLLWDACNKISRNDVRFFGTGNEIRDWLHVHDAADLIFHASKKADASCPVVNGATGIGTPVKEIIAEILQAYHVTGQPVFSDISRPGDPTGYIGDAQKASEWGWQPRIQWRDGVREYIRWYKANNDPRK